MECRTPWNAGETPPLAGPPDDFDPASGQTPEQLRRGPVKNPASD
jgi:hypothetical protein